MKPANLTFGLMFALTLPGPAAAQATLWSCNKPSVPSRFATSEERKKEPPPCEQWIELRGPNLEKIIESLSADRFTSASEFLQQATALGAVAYPNTTAEKPVATNEVFRRPEAYGLKAADVRDAPVGSLVLYNGLGGILVEARQGGSPWEKKVVYPSAKSDFRLAVGDLNIPGKQAPKILVDRQERQ